jgi:osmotically-inducible protein OsmY
MEHYDPRRRQANDEQQRYSRNEERDRDRDALRPRDDDRNRHHASEQRGWLDYDRDYSRSEDRFADRGSRDERRYGSERSRFSPDWSREGTEPRYSDDPYYSRNRDFGSGGEQTRGGSWQGDDDRSRWEQRARGRDVQRSRDDDQEAYYQGYYSQSATPIRYPGGSGMVYSESLTLHGPYSGRGPKGYRRSDQQIIEEASQRLERDGDVDASEIEVSAENGVITLRGTVDDRATKRRAEACVESVYGVRDVMNELRVAPQREPSQESQASQKARGARGSQPAHASQTSQSSQSAQTAQSSRASGGAPGAEPAGDDRSAKH